MLKNIKRIGKKTYKFQVDVFFEKVSVNIKFPCQLFIIWKRGPRKQETKPVEMNILEGAATFNEYLQMGATLFQDVKTKRYQEKKTSFTVVISTPKGNKVAGACELDLGSYPNQNIQERKEVLNLKKSPDPNAKIHLMIKVALISEADNMSVLSGITEQDSFDEAGSNEASQFEIDTTRVKSSTVSNPPVRDLDNILADISSRPQLQQEIKGASFKQQDRVQEEDEEEEESPKKASPIHNSLGRSKTEVTRPVAVEPVTSIASTGTAPATGESKKAGFSKLFEKSNKESVSEVSSRMQQKTQQNSAGQRQDSQERFQDRNQENQRIENQRVENQRNGDTRNYQEESERQTKSKDRGDQGGDVQSLRDEIARKQNELNKIKNMAEQLRRENEDLKQNSSSFASTSDEVIELRDRINGKNGEITDLNKRNDELQQNIEDLKQTIYKLNKEKGQETRNITQDMDKLKNQIRQVEQERNQMQQENQNLSSKINKMQNDWKNLMSDYNSLKQENASNRELLEATSREKEDASQSTQSYEIELKRYKDKAWNMEQEVQRLREQIKEITTEKEGYQRKGMEMSNLFKEKMRTAEEENNNLRGKIQELEKTYREQVNKSENTILELKKQIKEAETKKEDALSKQTQLAIELQNLRINFEKVNSELEYKNETYSTKSKDMESIKEGAEKENTKLRDKLASMESHFKTREIEFQQKIDQLKETSKKSQTDYEEAAAENERLKSNLKNREHESSMSTASHSSELDKVKAHYASELDVMKQNLELRDTAFNNLKKENKNLFDQVEELKKRNADLEVKADEKPAASNQVVELQNQIRLTETNWKNQMKELKEENDKLKKELSTIQKHNQASQDVEKQVGQLSIENETLKKQVRDLTAKANNTQSTASNQQAKENEELKKKEKDFKKTVKKLEDDLLETKTKLSQLEGKTDEDEKLIIKLNKKIEKSQESVSVMETELVKTKQKMGEIMNVIMESAESELVDKVNSVVYENNY